MKRAIVLSMFAAVAAPAFADELWRQAPMDSFGGLSSQDARNSGGLGWFSEVVDNFDAPGGWTIESLEFWGGYAAVTPGNTRGFMIRFYEDSGGQVGPLLSTEDVSVFTREPFNDPYACDCDFNSPMRCDIFDFLCFQNEFARGCP